MVPPEARGKPAMLEQVEQHRPLSFGRATWVIVRIQDMRATRRIMQHEAP
jgi:hypothetical protein